MKVGSSGSSLHIEHLHIMICIILEDILSVIILFEYLSKLLSDFSFAHSSCPIIIPENFIQSRIASPAGPDLTCTEVDRTTHSTMYTAKVEHKFTVDIEPEVIVTGEFENNIMSPGIKAISCLGKACFHFHPEEIICIA